jgi:hypothetical protein
MKIYRTDKGGIGIWKLSGVVGRDDAQLLVRSLYDSAGLNRGCVILDFEKVKHVDYRAFNVLEEGYPQGGKVLLSGLSDYVLGIFAFVARRNIITVYPDWKKAFRYLTVERGKLGTPLAAGSSGSE